MATGSIHLKSPYFEADQGLININSVDSGQLASLNGQREDRTVWVHGSWGWKMGCYRKWEVGPEMSCEMKMSICAEDKFCPSETVFLPFWEEFKWSFSMLSANIV